MEKTVKLDYFRTSTSSVPGGFCFKGGEEYAAAPHIPLLQI